MSEESNDLNLSDVWMLMENAGATVYEIVDESGVSMGFRAIKLGENGMLTVNDTTGYACEDRSDFHDRLFVPADEYDEAEAVRKASDIRGWFAIVGIPGSIHHQFAWFDSRPAAVDWMEKTVSATLEANRSIGSIEADVWIASDVFDVTYRDGKRVYFEPAEVGQGFAPKAR